MTTPARLLFLCATLAACGEDIQLGVGPTAADARPDVAPGMFIPGPYSITFRDPIHVDCVGTLAGMEASFTSITRSSLSVVDGAVTLAMPSSSVLTITGTPMEEAFRTASLALSLDLSGGGTNTWDANVPGGFGTGPLSTQQIDRAFAVDASTAGDASVSAAIAIHFQTSDMQGDCAALFDAALVHQ